MNELLIGLKKEFTANSAIMPVNFFPILFFFCSSSLEKVDKAFIFDGEQTVTENLKRILAGVSPLQTISETGTALKLLKL